MLSEKWICEGLQAYPRKEEENKLCHVCILKIIGNCWTISIREGEVRKKLWWFPLEGWVNEVTPQSWAVKVKCRSSRHVCVTTCLWAYLNLRLLIWPSKKLLVFDFANSNILAYTCQLKIAFTMALSPPLLLPKTYELPFWFTLCSPPPPPLLESNFLPDCGSVEVHACSKHQSTWY